MSETSGTGLTPSRPGQRRAGQVRDGWTRFETGQCPWLGLLLMHDIEASSVSIVCIKRDCRFFFSFSSYVGLIRRPVIENGLAYAELTVIFRLQAQWALCRPCTTSWHPRTSRAAGGVPALPAPPAADAGASGRAGAAAGCTGRYRRSRRLLRRARRGPTPSSRGPGRSPARPQPGAAAAAAAAAGSSGWCPDTRSAPKPAAEVRSRSSVFIVCKGNSSPSLHCFISYVAKDAQFVMSYFFICFIQLLVTAM